MLKKPLRNRLKYFAKTCFSGRLSSMQSAQCVSFGLLWGVFPLVGTSTLLCTISALCLRLNIAVVQAVNYLVYPLQLVLLVPFMKLGAFVTGTSIKLPSLDELKCIVGKWLLSETTGLADDIFHITVSALTGWVIVAPLMSFAAGIFVYFAFEIRKNKFAFEKTQQP